MNTIYNWLNNWEKNGPVSLYRTMGQRHKPKLSDIKLDVICKLVEKHPNQLKKVVSELDREFETKDLLRNNLTFIEGKYNNSILHEMYYERC